MFLVYPNLELEEMVLEGVFFLSLYVPFLLKLSCHNFEAV